jgi:ABC-2 type transport system permease protein
MYSNFLRFPMAFLAGTFVPLESMPPLVAGFARLLPLTYSVEALREAMGQTVVTATFLVDMLVLALSSAALVLLSTWVLVRSLD